MTRLAVPKAIRALGGMENAPTEKRGVQSIGVGLNILSVLSVSDSALSLTAIAVASGVPGSSCHRYLTSFIKAGFVKQDPVSGRYDLGPGVIQAGLAALRRSDPIVIGLAMCERLARLTGRTAQLAIWSDAGPVIVSWRMGLVPVPTNMSVGSRLPLLTSATGKAFLAHLPKAFWRPLMKREGGTMRQASAIAEQVRAKGVSTVSGDVIPGLAAAAAPILDVRGEPVAVVALLGLIGQLTPEDTAHLVQAAIEASAELGSVSTSTI